MQRLELLLDVCCLFYLRLNLVRFGLGPAVVAQVVKVDRLFLYVALDQALFLSGAFSPRVHNVHLSLLDVQKIICVVDGHINLGTEVGVLALGCACFVEAEHLEEGGATLLSTLVCNPCCHQCVHIALCFKLHLGCLIRSKYLVLSFHLGLKFGDKLLLEGELGLDIGDFEVCVDELLLEHLDLAT